MSVFPSGRFVGEVRADPDIPGPRVDAQPLLPMMIVERLAGCCGID